MATRELPLFPLGTVLFPGGPLALRIFEARYLSMISRCLREGSGFGVVLIHAGSEIGDAEFFTIGTVAEIVDWHQGADGLLEIVAEGRERFRVAGSRRQADGLYIGEVELLPPEPQVALPEEFRRLREVLAALLAKLEDHYAHLEAAYDDASWVGYRLAEILPIPAATRQSLLELSDARRRLRLLEPHLAEVAYTMS